MVATYMKRVQTVVSFSQLEEDSTQQDKNTGGFGPTSAVAECPGHNLPLYRYASCPPPKLKYRRVHSMGAIAIVPDDDDEDDRSFNRSVTDISMFGEQSDPLDDASEDGIMTVPTVPITESPGSPSSPTHPNGNGNLLDTVVTALWDDCAANGLFRYDVADCCTKIIPGKHDFVIQLNEGRATKKRATEFRVDKVLQPFDETKFNFKKAYAREVLFQFELNTGDHNSTAHLVDSAVCSSSPNLVIINVSPIEYGHVLLVPRVLDNIPQLVDPGTVELALHFAKEADNSSFRVGYNSLGAYATINHLHFQAYYLDATFPCELAATEPIKGVKRSRNGVFISRLVDYPVNGFVVELDADVAVAEGIPELAAVVGQACMKLQQSNIPHNLFITGCGRKTFIWPQCFAERQAQGLIPEEILESGVNPAAFEIAGHILLKRQVDYDAVDESAVCALLGQASLPEERFLQVAHMCFGACTKHN